jgi:hypothetical protein
MIISYIYSTCWCMKSMFCECQQRVGQVPCPAGCVSIRVTMTLWVMSDNLSLQSSHSMFGVLFEEMDMDMVMVILSL